MAWVNVGSAVLGGVASSVVGSALAPDAPSGGGGGGPQRVPINTSFGGTDLSGASANVNLSPEMLDIQQQIYGQYGQATPDSLFNLMQQQIAPYREQRALGLENRLFSQGLMGASRVDQPGGARRSLFDSFGNQDLQMQLAARGQAMNEQTSLFNQLTGISNIENQMLNASLGFGAQAIGADQFNRNMQWGADVNRSNIMGEGITGAMSAFGNEGGWGSLFGSTTGDGQYYGSNWTDFSDY